MRCYVGIDIGAVSATAAFLVRGDGFDPPSDGGLRLHCAGPAGGVYVLSLIHI